MKISGQYGSQYDQLFNSKVSSQKKLIDKQAQETDLKVSIIREKILLNKYQIELDKLAAKMADDLI